MGEIINPDAGDPASMDKWIKMVGAVGACAETLDRLKGLYGAEIFHIACTIVMENMDQHYFYQTERYRYLNSKLGRGESKVGKLFIPPKDPRFEQ